MLSQTSALVKHHITKSPEKPKISTSAGNLINIIDTAFVLYHMTKDHVFRDMLKIMSFNDSI